MTDVQNTGLSRVFLMENRAGPTTTPQYMGLWRAGSLSFDQGDITRIFIPDENRYGAFKSVGQYRGSPGNPEMTLTARSRMALSDMLRLARRGCMHDVQIHFGRCKNPSLFNTGWEKILVLEGWEPTGYETDELGALGPDDQAVINEMLSIAAQDAYEIKPLAIASEADTLFLNEVYSVILVDEDACALCGLVTKGNLAILAVTASTGNSPGLPGEIIYSIDGGLTWEDKTLTTLPAGVNPSDMILWGENVVFVPGNATDAAWHYALLSTIVTDPSASAGFFRVALGLSGVGSPKWLFAPDPTHLYSVGLNSRIYLMQNLADNATVLHQSGDVTTEDLERIHGIDNQQFLVVGAANTVLLTRNGGRNFSAITGPSVGNDLLSVWMVSEDTWWVGTETNGELWYTTNGGRTWAQKRFIYDGSGKVWDIKFATPTVGYMTHSTSANVSRLYRTIDGGNTWYPLPEDLATSVPVASRLRSIAVVSTRPNVAYAGGDDTTGADGILLSAT